MNLEQDLKLQVACMNIRHKLMYVDDRHATRGMVDDSSDTRVFFCVKTQESLGPDGDAVCPTDCDKNRTCYCGDTSGI